MGECNRVDGNKYVPGRGRALGSHKVRLPSAGMAALRNTQRAFLMCKPDAVSRGLASSIISDVSEKLKEREVPHRIVAPKLFTMPVELARKFYDNMRPVRGEKAFEETVRYVSGTHTDARIPQAPVVTFILEARLKEGEDLIKLLRSDDLIGPTIIVEGKLKDNPSKEAIMRSIRYKYTVGMGMEQLPVQGGPGKNCIHCSGKAEEAGAEISLMYDRKELEPYYSPEALDLVYKEAPANVADARKAAVSLPLPEIVNLPQHVFESRYAPVFSRLGYRDFPGQALSRMFTSASEITKIAVDTGAAFQIIQP